MSDPNSGSNSEGDQDGGPKIENESPRAADDPRYNWLESNQGEVVIYDERSHFAWLQSSKSVDRSEWE